MGPSANNDVCPENDKVGENINNTAHSMGRYGLRIFHNMVPRMFPCRAMVFDPSTPDNPYWMNPPITANFDNFVGWKNNRNGAIAERVGDVAPQKTTYLPLTERIINILVYVQYIPLVPE